MWSAAAGGRSEVVVENLTVAKGDIQRVLSDWHRGGVVAGPVMAPGGSALASGAVRAAVLCVLEPASCA
jgi:hypothetical protein